ncbi:hypothetical protein TrVE_jg3231 [Triparma verrucosa]|uniref:J domain-containing protein n=1 Tax=Triparma verrucosa TaxID=1606542 RepID=A0A9W7BW34_9STRA|nr:hypothetical protein TrVE_jg3231 [Triparma verrucosa]
MADQSTADIENLSPKDKTDLSSSNNNNNNAERPAQGPSPKKDKKKKDKKKKKRDKKRDKKGDHIDHEQEQEDDDHDPGEDHDGHDVVGEGDGDGDGDGGTLGGGGTQRPPLSPPPPKALSPSKHKSPKSKHKSSKSPLKSSKKSPLKAHVVPPENDGEDGDEDGDTVADPEAIEVDEIDIEAETERLKELEETLEENKAEALRLRTIVENSRRVMLDRKAESLEDTLKNLDKEITDNRQKQQSNHETLGKMQVEELSVLLMEAKFDAEVHEVERDYALDEIVLRKMELDRIRQRAQLLEELQMDRLAALEAVDEERVRRKYEQEHKLEILLGKIPHLHEAGITADSLKDKTDYIMGDYDDEEAEDQQVYRLGDISNKMREEKHLKDMEEMRKDRKGWIAERLELIEEKRILSEERERLKKLETKGLDYLVKVEKGEEVETIDDVKDLTVKVDELFDDDIEEEHEEKEEKAGEKAEEKAEKEEENQEEKEEEVKEETPLPPKPEPPSESSLEEPDWKALLTTFYEKYNPTKLSEVDDVLKKKPTVKDREKVFAKLAKKYNCDDPLIAERKRLEDVNKDKKEEYEKKAAEYDAALEAWESERDKAAAAKAETAEDDKDNNNEKHKDAKKEEEEEKPKIKPNPLPPEIAKITRQVERQIPKSETNKIQLLREFENLSKEMEWIESQKPKAWRDAESRLDRLDEEEQTRRKKAFKNEFAAFDDMQETRMLKKKRLETERELHQTCLDVQKEVVEEAIKGIWVEILRLAKFSERESNECIFFALNSVCPSSTNSGGKDEYSSWRPSMWYGNLMELQKDRKKADEKVLGTSVCRRTQKLREHFINNDAIGAKKVDKRVKVDDLRIPSAEDADVTVVRLNKEVPAKDVENLANFKRKEKEFWGLVESSQLIVALPRGIGCVTKVSTGTYSGGGVDSGKSKVMLTCGTTKGAILLYYLEPASKHHQLIRQMNELPKPMQSPINSIQLSADSSSQLLTLDDKNIVRLWTLETKSGKGDGKEHTRDAFPEKVKGYSPPIPAVALTLTSGMLLRPGFKDASVEDRVVSKYESENTGGGFLGVGSKSTKLKNEELKELSKIYTYAETEEDLTPTTASFHPSMTLMATQCSLVVGCSNGSLVKWNNISKTAGETTVSSLNVIYGPPVPSTEPGDPTNSDPAPVYSVDSKIGECPKREYFSYHKSPIISVHFLEHMSLDMVSVDSSGFCALWKYEDGYFTGHTWFEPSRRFKFNLEEEGLDVSPPKIITTTLSWSGSDLLILSHHNPKTSPFLLVTVFNLLSLKFLPHTITIPLKSPPLTKPTITSSPPPHPNLPTDYCIITVNNTVKIYSLSSGEEVEPSPIETGGEVVLSASVGGDFNVLAFETPNLSGKLMVNFFDYGGCGGFKVGSKMSRSFELGLLRGGLVWKDFREIVEEAVEEVFKVGREKEVVEKEEEGGGVQEDEEDSLRKMGEKKIEQFLGEEDLGTVEPVRLK